MNEVLKSKCDSLFQNYNKFAKVFKFESTISLQSCALLYTINDKTFDEDLINECKNDLKNHYGAFSSMRGLNYPLVSTLLSFYKHPLEALYVIKDIYNELKKSFSDSVYLSSVSFVLYDHVKRSELEETILRIKKLYKKIKKEHPLLTSSEDAPLITLLVLTKKSDEEILYDVDECFKLLKDPFRYSNPRQSLSHLLALYDESSEIKCQKVKDLYLEYKNQGIKYSKGESLPLLGVQAMESNDYKNDVKEVIEMESYIKSLKKFSSFYISKDIRIAYATSLMIDYNNDNQFIKNSVITNVMLTTLIQQTLVLYMIIATNAALVSSN